MNKFILPIGTLTILSCMVYTCKDMPPDPGKDKPDTTSHNFAFTVDTLGYSGVLYDVAIVDENNIWVVGEVYSKDSTGQVDPSGYSYAFWNGSKWKLKRLYYDESNLIIPLRGIFLTGPSHIWIAAGGVFSWDGVSMNAQLSFSRLVLPDENASIEKIWGTSNSNLYGVGNAGTIIQYNGNTWQRVITGTNISMTDIWGIPASNGGVQFVIAVGSNLMTGADRHVLAVSQTGVKDTLGWTMEKTPYSIWFTTTSPYYISGNGVWKRENSNWTEVLPMNFVNRVRGSADNNIFVAGSFAYMAHYNGSTWKEFPEIRWPYGVLRGLAVHPKVVIAVGDAADVPIVIRAYPR